MLHQKPLHSENVTVWCGVSAFGVLGPYFFENATGQSVTVTSDRYVELLREFLNDKLCRLRVDTSLVWFQQDGATAHTAQHEIQWQSSEECFRNMLFLVSETLNGLHDRPIYQHAIFSCGAI
jgi:hypothetical protein